MEFLHKSILLKECIDGLEIKPDGIYADITAGGGGHSIEIVKKLECGGKLIVIDRDNDALEACRQRLAGFFDRVEIVKANFNDTLSVLEDLGISGLDGILADLGVSSYQLDNTDRGFSYSRDAFLDMRMDTSQGKSAFDVINTYTYEQLVKIFFEYGEENYSKRIASRIIQKREESPINTTLELSKIIISVMPGSARREDQHPAKRIFQAVRLEVNGELEALKQLMNDLPQILNPGGVAAFIMFHSLEDRIVKQGFVNLAKGCICPKEFPVCRCDNKPKLKIITKKPILPGAEEIKENPRARSAKLRLAKKI